MTVVLIAFCCPAAFSQPRPVCEASPLRQMCRVLEGGYVNEWGIGNRAGESILSTPVLQSQSIADWFEPIAEFGRQIAATVGAWARATLPPVAHEHLVLILATAMLALGLALVLSGLRLRRKARMVAAAALVGQNSANSQPAAPSQTGAGPSEGAAAAEQPEFALDPTRRAKPGNLALPMPETTIETSASTQFPPQAPSAWLHFMDAKGTRVPIGANPVRIGRHTENEIILENRTVHRHHAVIHMAPTGKFVITDLDTVNRVFVNHVAAKVRELEEGDLVELGEVRFRFRMLN